MPRLAFVIALGLSFGSVLWSAPPAYAQAAPSPSPVTDAAGTAAVQPASDDDDDGTLRPLEPDFTIVNLPTTLPLPRFKGNFHLTHRFNQNLARAPFKEQLSNLFGMDQGATIQFEYRVGIMRHLQAIAARTNNGKTFQFSGKYDAFHESSRPFGLSAMVSVEGEDNFQRDYAPALGVVVSRTLGSVAAVYASPFWVHNTLSGTGISRDTGFVGIGGRLQIRPTVYLVGEVSPRIGGFAPGDANYAFAIEKRVGAHVFSLTFSNSAATTFAQLARGGIEENLQFGFNLARKFF